MSEKKYCYKYPHPSVTTDCVIFGFDSLKLKVLLVERGIEPYKGRWAFPGGFLRIDEDAETGAMRELLEETGLKTAYVRQLHTFSAPQRDPRERVITIAYYALVQLSEVKAGDDAAKAQWFSLDNVPALAFDHDLILRTAINELRRQIHFEPIGFDLMDSQFTIPDLQRLYESILGVRFDRRNFMKKIVQSGVISECDECIATPSPRHAGRTPKSYTFNKDVYDAMKGNGRFKMEF